jgi:hypothetical protein
MADAWIRLDARAQLSNPDELLGPLHQGSGRLCTPVEIRIEQSRDHVRATELKGVARERERDGHRHRREHRQCRQAQPLATGPRSKGNVTVISDCSNHNGLAVVPKDFRSPTFWSPGRSNAIVAGQAGLGAGSRLWAPGSRACLGFGAALPAQGRDRPQSQSRKPKACLLDDLPLSADRVPGRPALVGAG